MRIHHEGLRVKKGDAIDPRGRVTAIDTVLSRKAPYAPKLAGGVAGRNDARTIVLGVLAEPLDGLGTSRPEIHDACGERLQAIRQGLVA